MMTTRNQKCNSRSSEVTALEDEKFRKISSNIVLASMLFTGSTAVVHGGEMVADILRSRHATEHAQQVIDRGYVDGSVQDSMRMLNEEAAYKVQAHQYREDAVEDSRDMARSLVLLGVMAVAYQFRPQLEAAPGDTPESRQ